MKINEKMSFKTNKFIKLLISALIQITFYLTLIGFFEYILIALELSNKTPKKILYLEAFALYLLGRVAKSIVAIFKSTKESDNNDNDNNDENNDENEDDEDDEDFF